MLCWLLGAPLDDIDDRRFFAEEAPPELSSPGQAGSRLLSADPSDSLLIGDDVIAVHVGVCLVSIRSL